MVNFLLFLLFCLSHYPIGLSGCLKDLIYQEVLMEVLHGDCDKMELAYVVFWGLIIVEYVYDLSDDVETMVWANLRLHMTLRLVSRIRQWHYCLLNMLCN